MNNAKRKIFLGTLFFGCSIAAIGGAAVLSDKMTDTAVPSSLTDFNEELPVIILDAGHGGIDGGCVSAEGVPEKGINLNILLRLRDMLEISGYTVEVTRDSDMSIHDAGIEGIANQKSSDMDKRCAFPYIRINLPILYTAARRCFIRERIPIVKCLQSRCRAAFQNIYSPTISVR